jgi:polyvinyl alcohol dehydrogenase (cytochrome)
VEPFLVRLSRLALPLSFVLAAVGLPAGSPPAVAAPAGSGQFVLSPEGNRLWAYDAATGAAQLVNPAENGSGDPGMPPPTGSSPRDINGQVCVSPDQRHVVTGEDTVFGEGTSHDPRIAGWGYFAISGSRLDEIRIRQIGKLAPEAGPGPGYTGDPDNFGCGFLDSRRLVTTAIGNTLPGEPANGQLFLWFAPFDRRFRKELAKNGDGFLVGEVAHCELDHTLATAGGVAVDRNGDVYVATNRPTEIPGGDPGGIWRFSGRFPRSLRECTPAFLERNVTKELIIPISSAAPADPTAPTPSAVAISPEDTLYVSSVFSGTVSEFSKDGVWMRDLYPLSPVSPRTGPTTQTPFGLAVTRDGSLWIADLGIALAAPAPGQGSVIRVPLADVAPIPETVKDGLTFPDGLGVYSPRTSPASGKRAASEWPCGDWGMYGRTLSRQFSNGSGCPTRISPQTVGALQPAWTFRVPPEPGDQTTFTASPAIVDGVVYVGSWNGVMYALNLSDGSVIWEHQTDDAPGATFGPIVSSAAVADVGARRMVFFGSGPRLHALDAADGHEVWSRYFGKLPGDPDDPAEVESSPLVWNDTVYVGMDVHNQRGDETGNNRGGIFALDARTGRVRWKYHSEAAAGQPASGCGGVWGSPTLDMQTELLYFGTANCPAVNDNPRLPMEEITALRARTGKRVWTFRPHQPPGQESYDDQDEDFGATPNLFHDQRGRKILGAGSKDGSYYALHPATGKVLWNTSVTSPAPGVGGFIGSPAVWGGHVFGAVAIGSPPWYHSLDGRTGNVRWQGTAGPSYGASAVTSGVVFAGALDFTVKAFDAETGRVLWSSPALGAVSSGPAVVGDMLLIGSGTSTSDACAKDLPASEVCLAAFDAALSQQGGLHAYRLPALPLP